MYRHDYYLAYLPEIHFISYFKQLSSGISDNLIIAHGSQDHSKAKKIHMTNIIPTLGMCAK